MVKVTIKISDKFLSRRIGGEIAIILCLGYTGNAIEILFNYSNIINAVNAKYIIYSAL